jgi:hypothetical protein
MAEVTRLLDDAAELLPLVYDELRKLAAARLPSVGDLRMRRRWNESSLREC